MRKTLLVGEKFSQLGVDPGPTSSFPKFSAYLSSDAIDATGDGSAWTIVADTEDYDVGSHYDHTTGIFTSPVGSPYFFGGVVKLEQLSISFTAFRVRFVSTTEDILVFEGNPGAMRTATNDLVIPFSRAAYLATSETQKWIIEVGGATKTIDVGQIITRVYGNLI
jgi:hypothetical protein